MKVLTVKCPQCKTIAYWKDNPFRPFCSERCKMIDLGKWADGSYAIAAKDEAPSREEGYDDEV